MKILLLLMSFFLLSSCASSKKDITERIFGIWSDFQKTISEQEIRAAAERRPELKKGFSLVVYFRPPPQDKNWRWNRSDKEMLLSALSQKGIGVGRVNELLNFGAQTEEVKNLRLMAAQQGADALLIVDGVSEVSAGPNPWAITYVALLPMLFVKGNDVAGAFLTQGVMWDVREPFIHLGAQAEASIEKSRPLVFQQRTKILGKAKAEALQELQPKLVRGLQELKAGVITH